jgi:PAS domain S-box-containing protein
VVLPSAASSPTSAAPRGLRPWLQRLRSTSADIGLPLPLLLASLLLAGIAASILIWSSALQPTALRDARAPRDRIVAFDRISQRMMMAVANRAAGRAGSGGFATTGDAWTAFILALDSVCPLVVSTQPDLYRLQQRCRRDDALRARLTTALDEMSPHDAVADPVILRELVADRDEIVQMRDRALDTAFALERRMVDDFSWALLVLEASAAGFGLSALALVYLMARAALRHLADTRRARKDADEAMSTRNLLHETIESIPAGLVVYDQDERLLLFNTRAAAINPVLYRPESKGRTYEQLLHDMIRLDTTRGRLQPGDIPGWLAAFREQRMTVHRSPDGRWFELSTVTTASGNHIRVRLDITTLKNQQRLLERERERYQMLVESLTDTVFTLDFEGTFLYASPPVLSLIGVPADQIVGRNQFDFIHPDDFEMVRSDARALFRSKSLEVHQRLMRLQTIDGEVRHVEVRYRRMLRREDDPTAVVGVMRDVTTTVRMTQRLAQERERLRSIVESSGAVLLLTDADLNVIVANREFWRLSRRGSTDAGNSRLAHPALAPAVLERWRTGHVEGDAARPVRYTRIHEARNGQIRLFSVTATPIADAQGRLSQIVFLAVDDTERQASEQALFAADRMKTLGEMAATVAHDIRQPLQAILFACEVAKEDIDDRDLVLDRLSRITQQVSRANAIVEELRLFARGSAADPPRAFEAGPAIQAAIELVTGTHRHAALTARYRVEAGLAPLWAHPVKLEQVLVNLLGNAHDAGATTVEIAVTADGPDDARRARITVSDDGPGIPAAILPRLFRSFVTTKSQEQGTGLGLRICHRLVEEMGGSIAAANRSGSGAEFTILLPLQSDRAPA